MLHAYNQLTILYTLGMKTFLRIIALILITCVVGFVLFYDFRPENYKSPTSAELPPIIHVYKSTKNESTTSSVSGIPVSVEGVSETASTGPSISVEYPQFPTLPSHFNNDIRSAVMDRLTEFRKIAAENDAVRRATAKKGEVVRASDYSFVAKWQSAQINSRYVSFILRFDSYTGGANENQEIQTFNYDATSNKIMTVSDLLPGVSDTLGKMSAESRKQLIENLNKSSEGDAPIDQINSGTEPVFENFANFTFDDSVLKIYFPKYAVAPGSFGEQVVTIPINTIR